jgi:MtN3 and saliva related transmembrane protein
MRPSIETVGYLAGLLTTVAFVPQVIKTWKSKSADDLSPGMLAAFSLGVGLWLVYGVAVRSTPIVAANAVTLAQTIILVVLRVRYGARRT